jgi:ribonuclease P/MRP protein subunit RPP1
MSFYDFHIHSAFSEGESSLEQLASTAKHLGYKGICFAEYYKNDAQMKKLKIEIEKIKDKIGIEIFLGFEARDLKELETLRQKRRQFDILLAHGGDLKMNRIAVETPEVDILTHPEMDRQDSGLNHVLVKLAAKNNVAIEINFREIIISSKKTRSKVLENMQKNIKLCKKLKAPIILCSGAISHWELRDPKTLVSFVSQLGLELKEAENCLSKIPENISKQSKERRSEEWIMPGVKVIR